MSEQNQGFFSKGEQEWLLDWRQIISAIPSAEYYWVWSSSLLRSAFLRFFLPWNALANICSELPRFHALAELFSMSCLGTKASFAFFILILTQMHSEVFQGPLDMCYSTISIQKQVLESSFLLLSQTLKEFSNMCTLPFFSLNLF